MLAILLAALANATSHADNLHPTQISASVGGDAGRNESGNKENRERTATKGAIFQICDSEQASVGLSYIGPLSSRISTPRIRNTPAKHTETEEQS